MHYADGANIIFRYGHRYLQDVPFIYLPFKVALLSDMPWPTAMKSPQNKRALSNCKLVQGLVENASFTFDVYTIQVGFGFWDATACCQRGAPRT